MQDQNWYCIRTKSGLESTAQARLMSREIATLLPLYELRRSNGHGGFNKPRAFPLFPSYLFAYCSLEDYQNAAIGQRREVLSLLDFGTGPAVVPQIVIDELYSRQDERGYIVLDAPRAMVSGYVRDQSLLVIDGPLTGVPGLFIRDLDSGSRVLLLITLLGRQFEQVFSVGSVRPAMYYEV